jgi:hypothetical protein
MTGKKCCKMEYERWSLHDPRKGTYKVRRILSTYGVIYLCIAVTMATIEAKDRGGIITPSI